MPSLLSRLAALFPGYRPRPALPPVDPQLARLNLVQKVKEKLEATPSRPAPSGEEKIPRNYANGGVTGKVWFLPYLDSATRDTPEIRSAMRLMWRDGYVVTAWEPQIRTVASEDWQVQASEPGNPEAEEQADFCKAVLDTCTAGGMPDCVRSIVAGFGPDGFTLSEPVWGVAERGRLEKKVVLNALKARDCDTSVVRLEGDRFGNIKWVQSMRAAGEAFPIEDFVYARYITVYDEPLGMAAFRPAYGAYWMRDTVRKLRAVHHEKRMAGFLVGTYQMDDDKSALERVLRDAKTSTWACVPEGVKIEAVNLSTASEPDYRSFDESLRDEIVSAIAFATLQSIQGNVPDARGDSKVQKAMADLGPWFLMARVQEAFNKQIFPKLIDFNFPYPAAGGYPQLTFGSTGNSELMELAQLVQAAQGLGLKPSRKHYAKALSIQEADPNDPDDVLGQAPPQGMGGFGGGDPFGGGGMPAAPPGPPPGGGSGGVVPFSDTEHWHVHTFRDPVKWERQGNGTWKSSGGRTLSDAAYQRHLQRTSGRRLDKRGADLAKNPQLPPAPSAPPAASLPRGRVAVPPPAGPTGPGDDVGLGAAAVAAAVLGARRKARAAGKKVRKAVAAAGRGGVAALKVALGKGVAGGLTWLGGKARQLGTWLADRGWLERNTAIGSTLAEFGRRKEERFGRVKAAFDAGYAGRGSRKLVREISRVLGSRWSESRKKYGGVLATAVESAMMLWGWGRGAAIATVGAMELPFAGLTGMSVTTGLKWGSKLVGGYVRQGVEAPAKLIAGAVTGKSFYSRPPRTVGPGRVAQAIEWAQGLSPKAFEKALAGRFSLAQAALGVKGSRDRGGEITPQQAAMWVLAKREIDRADYEGRGAVLDPAEEAAVRKAVPILVDAAKSRRQADAERDARNAARRAKRMARKTRLGRHLPFAEGTVPEIVLDLREAVDEMRALQGLPPTTATDDQLAGSLAVAAEEIVRRVGPAAAERFAETDQALARFGWSADKTRTGRVKAVGTGEHQGKTLYGRKAEAALSQEAGVNDRAGGFAVADLKPGRSTPARPGKELTDVRQVRKARTRAEGPDPEAAAAYREVENRIRAKDPAAVQGVQQRAAAQVERATAALPAPPDPVEVDRVVTAGLGRRAAGKVGGAIKEFFKGATGLGGGGRGAAGWLGSAVKGLFGGLAKLGRWAVVQGAKGLIGVAKYGFKAAKYVATSPRLRPFLVWGASVATAAAFMAAPILAVNAGLIPTAWAWISLPAAAGGAWMTRKVFGRIATRTMLPGSVSGVKYGPDRDPYQNIPGATYSEFAEGKDVALAGPDGRRAEELTAAARTDLTRLFADTSRAAVQRLLASGDPLGATVLFTDDELGEIAAGITRTVATADLLGRARVRRRAKMAEAAASGHRFAEGADDPYHDFTEPVPVLVPAKAVEYIRGKVPEIDPGPDRYGSRLDRHATTMAIAADQTLLEKIKAAVVKELEGKGDATPDIDAILTDAGLNPADPQYAEMVARTNVNDALNAGAADEMQTPEMREAFPAWRYEGILDSRTGDDHRPRIGKYYPAAANFADVRGQRIWNCRCGFSPVHKSQMAGINVEERW